MRLIEFRRPLTGLVSGTRKKDHLGVQQQGALLVGKAARGAIPDQVGHLEAGQRRDVAAS
jgi:hypothetical protein